MSHQEVFTVPVGPGGGLAAVTAALARRLEGEADAPGTVAVYVSMVGVPERFTQCLVNAERGAWAECVSNEYLEGDLRLSQIDEDLLVAAGYQRPDDFSPNFHLVVEPPVDWPAVALLLAAPFATVFPCTERDHVEVRLHFDFVLADAPDADDPPWGDDDLAWDDDDEDDEDETAGEGDEEAAGKDGDGVRDDDGGGGGGHGGKGHG